MLRDCTGHSKHPLTKTQETTLHIDVSRLSIQKSDLLYFLQPRWRSSIQSAKTRLGADCGSAHELFITKFKLKLKMVRKTTKPFRPLDLNQIHYNYTVEGTDRFRGLNLVDRVPEELWMKVCSIVQEVVIKTIPRKKEMQEGKVVV